MNTFAVVFSAFLALSSAFPSGLPLPEGLRSRSGCGVSKRVYDGDRIVGGRDALSGEFPWQISLQSQSWWGSASHICGGSIYSERTIITAAHCVGGSPSSYSVVVGSLRKNNNDPPYQKTFKVQRIITHENYNSQTLQNDIAILILSESIDFAAADGYINPVCIPSSLEDHSGLVTASGWGALREGGSSPNVLQAVDVPVVSNAECANTQYGSMIVPSMICAGVSKGGKDSCQGDSGGPLIHRINGKATLVGVVSWGYGCARPNLPGVYTRVSHFIDWLNSKAV